MVRRFPRSVAETWGFGWERGGGISLTTQVIDREEIVDLLLLLIIALVVLSVAGGAFVSPFVLVLLIVALLLFAGPYRSRGTRL